MTINISIIKIDDPFKVDYDVAEDDKDMVMVVVTMTTIFEDIVMLVMTKI